MFYILQYDQMECYATDLTLSFGFCFYFPLWFYVFSTNTTVQGNLLYCFSIHIFYETLTSSQHSKSPSLEDSIKYPQRDCSELVVCSCIGIYLYLYSSLPKLVSQSQIKGFLAQITELLRSPLGQLQKICSHSFCSGQTLNSDLWDCKQCATN